jgi:Ribosomal protein L7/L12
LTDVGQEKLGYSRLFVTSLVLALRILKDLVDGAPKNVKEGVSEDEANDIKLSLKKLAQL